MCIFLRMFKMFFNPYKFCFNLLPGSDILGCSDEPKDFSVFIPLCCF